MAVDPALKFVSTFGTAATVNAIAVDQAGNSYIGGITEPQGFTTTPGAFEPAPPAGSGCGAFVAKIDPTGALVYSTYLCGSGTDIVYAIAVDSAGDAYVTGSAVSTDFPTTANAFQPTCATYPLGSPPVCADAFVAELNPAGSGLVYSSYLGGSSGNPTSPDNNEDVSHQQYGTAIAVDSTGAAYVTGQTFDSDFPTTPGAFQTTFGGGTCGTSTVPMPCIDAFVAKVAPGGGSLVYSTFLGGSGADQALGVAVDQAGDAYVAGGTTSVDFPTLNAFQPTCATYAANGGTFCGNAFVTELGPTGADLLFSTYLGGPGASGATALALDGAGDVTVTGFTNAAGFPVVNAIQPSFPSTAIPPRSPFVTQFAPGGASLVFSTYLGGSGDDFGWGVAADGFGEAFVTGDTQSSDFPVSNAIQSTNQGALQDAFVTAFQAGGQGLIYSTYLGGPAGSSTGATSIAVDSQGDAWVAGGSDASTFPTARAEVVRHYGAPRRLTTSTSSSPAAMAASIRLDAGRVSAAPASLAFGPELAGGTTTSQAVTISNPGTAALAFSSIAASDSFAVASGGTCSTSSAVAPNGNCTVNVAFAPTMGGDLAGTLTLTDNGIGSPHTVQLSGTGQDFALSAATSSATLRAGGSASFALQISPRGGFTGTVALACSGAPAQAACFVGPASVTLDGSQNASATVGVATTAPSAAPPVGTGGPLPPGMLWWLAALLAGGLAFTAIGNQRTTTGDSLLARRRCSRPDSPAKAPPPGWRSLVRLWSPQRAALAAILIGLVLAASCGGGGAAILNPGTPAGTYTLTVTGTFTSGSTTLTRSQSLKLTVQ